MPQNERTSKKPSGKTAKATRPPTESVMESSAPRLDPLQGILADPQKRPRDAFWGWVKRNGSKRCLIDGCPGKPVQCHSIQSASVLEGISEDRHVYVLESDISGADPSGVFFKRKGIREATTFPGFCISHDGKLFNAVDFSPTNPFNPKNSEQIAALSLRSVARELWLKRAAVDFYGLLNSAISSRSYEQLIDIADGDEKSADFLNRYEKARVGAHLTGLRNSLKRVERAFKSLLNQCDRKEFHLSRFQVYKFPNVRNIAASTILSPLFDIHGNRIGSLLPQSEGREMILNIFPQEGTTWVVFLYHKRHDAWLSKFFEPLKSLDKDELGGWLGLVLLAHCENVAFAPGFLETLQPGDKEYLKRVYGETVFGKQDYQSYDPSRVTLFSKQG